MLIDCAFSLLVLGVVSTYLMASSLSVTAGQVCPGTTAQVPVHLDLDPGIEANGLTFRVEVLASGSAPPPENLLNFQGAGIPSPSFKTSDTSHVRASWLQISPALTGTTFIGNVLVPIPAAASPGGTYTIHVAHVEANAGVSSVSVSPGPDQDWVVISCGPVHCDDGDPCTTDTRDPDTGACVHTPAELA